MANYRKAGLAARYKVCTRTIENWIEKGQLPEPDFYVNRFPFWTDETIEANERAAAAHRPAKTTEETNTT